ncbi:unnamed protein product [Symbiodinium natans]|uniref:Uncharacterized protein n=1 Tax=Symbiodinium natans TaxID=878477 RepID=A0A812PSW8_9DINO|nr:unnamed protein product [Symbiodinium natans]
MAASGAVEQSYLVRRADPDDVDTIDALYERLYGDGSFSEAMAIFHAVDKGYLYKQDLRVKFLLSLVETSFMSVTVEDEEGHVVGFAVLDAALARLWPMLWLLCPKDSPVLSLWASRIGASLICPAKMRWSPH